MLRIFLQMRQENDKENKKTKKTIAIYPVVFSAVYNAERQGQFALKFI